MHFEARIAGGLRSALDSIAVPSLPARAIATRSAQAAAPWRMPAANSHRSLAAAAVAILVTAVAVPAIAPAFVPTLEARVAQLMGWTPPPPPPARVWGAMHAQIVPSLADARRLVSFTIVAPAGLPAGTTLQQIGVAPTAVFDKRTHAWSVGPSSVTFTYQRTGRRRFVLLAQPQDPQSAPPPRYMFDGDIRDARGLPQRFAHFAWRNGNQVMSATAGEGITAEEIVSIRTAMNGTAIAPAQNAGQLRSGRTEKMIILPH
jgi:membrane-associated protease RseP (regulator of RpoE activity)